MDNNEVITKNNFSMALSNNENFKHFSLKKKTNIGNNGNSQQSTKKLAILNFKDKKSLSMEYRDLTIKKLKTAIDAIHKQLPISSTLEELYKAVENLCSYQLSSLLYEELKEVCENHVKEVVEEFAETNLDQFVFLRKMDTLWQSHCTQITMIRSIFLYLDRVYVLQDPSILSIWDVGLQFWRKHVMENKSIQRRTVEAILFFINNERNRETVDRGLLKRQVRMLADLQMYNDVFEPVFLTATKKLYSKEGERFMVEMDVPNYLLHVERRLLEETQRLLHYLEPNTRKALVNCVEKQFISKHLSNILNKGFNSLVDRNCSDHLKLMYALFARVDTGLECLCEYFGAYIKVRGMSIVNETEREKNMVQELLDFKEKLDCLIDGSFSHNEKFVIAMKDAFEVFINKKQNKPAELIAKFVDLKLKAGNKEASEDELERRLDRIMILFRFIQGKDVFEAFYKKDLAKRLLLGRSASVDSEKSMLSKLKQECGSSFTSKLEGMFKDMELSKDIMLSYKSHVHGQANALPIDLNVNILTMGYWPTYTPIDVHLPNQMVKLQEMFTTFYLSKHSGRKLQWHTSLGSCGVQASFPSGAHELHLSLFQCLCLLQFNEADEYTCKEINNSTGIEGNELKRTVQSLACGKFRVLRKLPPGKEVNSGDRLVFNKKFSHNLYKIKINQVQMRETPEENQITNEQVFQDRQYQVDAAIVRVLKTRKTLAHNLLVTELYNQLKFPIKPSEIKKRIESLIDRDYMERDKDNPNNYHYIA